MTIIQAGFEGFLELLPMIVSEANPFGRDLSENYPGHSAITSGTLHFQSGKRSWMEASLQRFSLRDSRGEPSCECNMKMWKRHQPNLIQTQLVGGTSGLTTHQNVAEEVTDLSGMQIVLHL